MPKFTLEEWLEFQREWFSLEQIRYLQNYFLHWIRPRKHSVPSSPAQRPTPCTTVPWVSPYPTFAPPKKSPIPEGSIKVWQYAQDPKARELEDFYWAVPCEWWDPAYNEIGEQVFVKPN
jgi:hypothetical protein